jgi:CelD/BcsL family acetyltransferase involved in cellulose biosynthesis
VSRELSIRVVTTLDEFGRLAPDWSDLLRTSESRGIFLTWEWLYEWGKQYLGDNRLLILIVMDEASRMRGIAPFYVRSVQRRLGGGYRELAFLGTEEVCSSHLDLIAARVHKRSVWQRLYWFLFEEATSEWDVMTLEEIPAESTTIGALLETWDEAGKVIDIVKTSGCPLMLLPGSVTDFRTTVSASRRYSLRRKQKALARLGLVSYRHIEKGPEVQQAFDAFVRLHEQRWKDNGAGGGAFHRQRFLAFHRQFVKRIEENGWLSISLLTLDERPVAGIYGFVYGNIYYYYLPGFDPDAAPRASPGMLLLYRRIEQAIEEGLGSFDFLQGETGYKAVWAGEIRRSLTLRAYNRRGRAVLLKLAQCAKQAAKIAVR